MVEPQKPLFVFIETGLLVITFALLICRVDGTSTQG